MMAQQAAPVSPFEHGTWDDLFWQIGHGKHVTAYTVGEVIPLTLTDYGAINARIVKFDADILADGTGYAPVTMVAQYLISAQRFNPALSNNRTGTGTIGGWGSCELRTFLRNTVLPTFPSDVRSHIANVKKYTRGYDTSGAVVANMESTDSLFALSKHEAFGGTDYETQGVTYTNWFSSASRRKATRVGSSTASFHRLRSADTNNATVGINNTGALATGCGVTNGNWTNILFGFCLA